MDDIIILELQVHIRYLRKQMAKVKKATKKPPFCEGINLNPTIYVRWDQILKDYFEVIGWLDEENFIVVMQKL